MDPVVPPGIHLAYYSLIPRINSLCSFSIEVTAELTQILSNLVLGDNEIRSKSAQTKSSPKLTRLI